MASVDGKTSIKIDDLVNDTVISGYVTLEGQLILVTRGGAEILAGTVSVGGLDSVQPGTNVSIDNSDPLNPIINVDVGSGIADRFINTDVFVADGPGDQVYNLTYAPKSGSLHVRWGPLNIPISRCSLLENVLTITDPNNRFRADDEITVAYAVLRDAEIIETPPTDSTVWDFLDGSYKTVHVSRTNPDDYSSPSFDDSSWATEYAPFGADFPVGYISDTVQPTWDFQNTVWAQNTRLWLRRSFVATAGQALLLTIRANRYVSVWINGTLVVNEANQNTTEVVYTVPGTLILASNDIAIRMTDDTSHGNLSGCYFDSKVEQ